jgi:S-methylmethionine-dependent homocysteine/selenocysteine methylase
MNTDELANIFEKSHAILGEGAVIERLRRNNDLELDPHIVNSAFIYDEDKRAALAKIYQEYMEIGREYDLPLLLSTPTWRASRLRIKEAGYEAKDVNADNFRFLDELRKSYGEYGEKIVICGLMSCKGDAYSPGEGLSLDEALEFHQWQAEKLADSGVDFTLAATLPALGEAKGLALALAGTGRPYVISFVARPEGTMLDGTPLKRAIAEIDDATSPKPLAFMINCTHATFTKAALMHETNSSSMVRERVIGLFANTAVLSPEDLNNSTDLVEEDPETFGKIVAELNKSPGLKMLGGCCGTDDRHINALASRLAL